MFYNILNKIKSAKIQQTMQNFLNEKANLLVNKWDTIPQNISKSSVIKWHDWEDSDYSWFSRYGVTKGWVYENHEYHFQELKLDEFKSFGERQVFENWQCEIQDVQGLAASKSKLEDFHSLDEMVKTNSKEMISPVTQEQLEKNLSWGECRIFHENSYDYFAIYLWDKRIFLVNAGGSHHFAAARYLARKLNQHIPLTGKLYVYKLNEDAVLALIQKFEMFVISTHHDFTNPLHEIMRTLKIDYFIRYAPRPYQNKYSILLLPKGNIHSTLVADIFKKNNVIDYGLHLMNLLHIQQT